jgi:hypothetical protein
LNLAGIHLFPVPNAEAPANFALYPLQFRDGSLIRALDELEHVKAIVVLDDRRYLALPKGRQLVPEIRLLGKQAAFRNVLIGGLSGPEGMLCVFARKSSPH